MTAITCTECGYENRGSARFCASCGHGLARACPVCGETLIAGARFCDACGAPADTARETTAEEKGAALKVVSVVFCDLVDSTAQQEQLDSESVRHLMARFYALASAAVELHGGQVERFIGDAVLAVFGKPVVQEDDALRAVRCAAAIMADLERLGDELEREFGVRLSARAAVNTGELVVGRDGILVGDMMNTAARLEAAADVGEVFVGEPTWRLVRHDVQLEPVEPVAAKGKSQPVKAWRLVSPFPSPEAIAAARIETPLVGREAELATLRAVFDDALAHRLCRLVTLIGSPGVGKSRLAREFAVRVGDSAMVVEGQCERSGAGSTYLPVAEVLRAAAGIEDADRSETLHEKLAALVGDDEQHDQIAAVAASILGAGDLTSTEETFWSVRRVLESAARIRPLVVVLDDVHWGEPLFLDLIEHLVEWVRDAPIMILALARPELRETREALTVKWRRAVEVVDLEGLGPTESLALVEGLLGAADLPDSLVAKMLETTEGNPLFLGELLRMLVDEGALARKGDTWVAPGGADAVEVPPTIQALLASRIERLGLEERTVVERAAVIGKQFYRGAVAELAPSPVRVGIDSHLETLRRKDMVEPEGTYWVDEPVYRFHHVLIRDAAYHLLLKESRAELHERFADWLEAKAGELVGEHEEVIAYHLEHAHDYLRRLGPLDDRGRALGARARARLHSAGRRALARADLAAAINLLQRALDCGETDDGEILWDLGEALLSAGDTAGAATVVSRLGAATVAARAGRVSVTARADVLASQLAILTGTGSVDDILATIERATAVLTADGDGTGMAKACHVSALALARLGQVAAVEAALDRALQAARSAEDRRRVTAVLAAAPRAALWGPSPVARASGRCLDVVRLQSAGEGGPHVEAIALRCQAVLEAMRGRNDAAREIIDRARMMLEELGLTLELHELATHAGIVELLAGEPGTAEALLRSAREGFASLGVAASAAQASALLGRALVEQGRDDEAVQATVDAERDAGDDLKTLITLYGVRAEAQARRGEHGEALALARRAAELADPTDALPDKADANMALARVLATAGRPDEARAVAAAAANLYLAKGHTVGAGRARMIGGEAAASERSASARAPERDAGASATATLAARRYAEYTRMFNEHLTDELRCLYTEDFVMPDRRVMSWEPMRGPEAMIALARSAYETAPDVYTDYEPLFDDGGEVVVYRTKFGGGGTDAPWEMVFDQVTVFRNGLFAHIELFDTGAETESRARFAELQQLVAEGRPLLP